MRALLDDDDVVVLVGHLRRRRADAPEQRDGLHLVGEGDHVEGTQRGDGEAEAREMIEIPGERVRIARHVRERRDVEPGDELARERAHPTPRRVHDRRVEPLVFFGEAPDRRGDVCGLGEDGQLLAACRLLGVLCGRCGRLDEMNVSPGLRHCDRDRAGAAVEIEHARLAVIGRHAVDADEVDERGVDALRLPAMSLHEGAVRGVVLGLAGLVLGRARAVDDDGLGAEDLRRLALVEIHRHADDGRGLLGELARRALEGLAIGDADALDDEGDEDLRPGVGADLAEIDGTQGAARPGVEGRERATVVLVGHDAGTQRGGDGDEGGREDAAAGDVDDLMAAALRVEAEATAARDDELRARPVFDDRIGGGDRLGVDELQRRIARGRLHHPPALHRELLAVGQADDRAATAAIRVLADHALRHGRGRVGVRDAQRDLQDRQQLAVAEP